MSVRTIIAVIFTVALSTTAASAQGAAATHVRDSTVRELLEEVRLLRRVLQATSLGTVRAQILLAQRQGHSERVSQIERQVADTRTAAREAQEQADEFRKGAEELETSLLLESDPSKRAEREEQIRQLGAAQQQMKQRAERQRERDTELSVLLSQEQARLEEVQRGLARLERELDELRQSVAPGASPR